MALRLVAARDDTQQRPRAWPTRHLCLCIRAGFDSNSGRRLPDSRRSSHQTIGLRRDRSFRFSSASARSGSRLLTAAAATERKPGPSAAEFRFDSIVSGDLPAFGRTQARFLRAERGTARVPPQVLIPDKSANTRAAQATRELLETAASGALGSGYARGPQEGRLGLSGAASSAGVIRALIF